MKLTAVTSITNNIVAARFWMAIALICGALAVTSPYLTIQAMKQKEKVVILDQGGTLIYSPLLGFEEAAGLQAYHVRLACLALLQRNPIGPDLPDLLKRMYLEEPARKKAAALYKKQNPEFKEKEIHQKVEVEKLDILDTRKMKDGPEFRMRPSMSRLRGTSYAPGLSTRSSSARWPSSRSPSSSSVTQT